MKPIKNHSPKKVRTRYFILAGVLILFVAGWIFLGIQVKKKGFSGALDFTQTVSKNYWSSFGASPERVEITINKHDLEKLTKARNMAIRRGLIINEADSYVPAEINTADQSVKISMRLKGHMTDHVEGDQWSFRIKVESKGSLWGMKWLTFQHPGTRGYIYEWIYHQLMKREGIIALRYRFIEVYINGERKGIYAVEENFNSELLENNGRPNGPLIRFNPDLYWVDRYNEILEAQPVAEYTSFQSARVEPYRENRTLKDPDVRAQFLKALELLEGFRAGKLKTSDIFDVPKLARFHAVIDLVGGGHSIDWSDVKYYYNKLSGRLEPIAYESFSVFPTASIAGLYRFKDLKPNVAAKDLHDQIFSDPLFFEEYIRALDRVSSKVYLDDFFGSVDNELRKNLAILNKQFPYKKFEKESYYHNQEIIQKIIHPVQGIIAYTQLDTSGAEVIKVGNLDALPFRIKSIVAGQTNISIDSVILPAKQKDQAVSYKLLAGKINSGTNLNELKVVYQLLGSSELKQVNVLPYEMPELSELPSGIIERKGNYSQFKFIRKVAPDKLLFTKGIHVIDQPVVIPQGFSLIMNHGTELKFEKKGALISFSPVHFIGDGQITISCNNESGSAIKVISAAGRSYFKNVTFTTTVEKNINHKEAALQLISSPASIDSCVFENLAFEDALNISTSKILINDTRFQNLPNDAIDINGSELRILNSYFIDCIENCLDMTASMTFASRLKVSGAKGKAVSIKQSSELIANEISVQNSFNAFSFENSSRGTLNNLTISNCEYGIAA